MAATQHAFGTGPHGQHNGLSRPNGPQPGGGPQNSAYAGPYRSQPEDQQHPPQPQPYTHNHSHPRPYYFVQPSQPSQPYYPYQWPVPMSYNPYCGFPGLGYGMVMPPFPPSPYMEAPGYIVPHAQLHLADYRRMVNPHFLPTMAYHTRRFRYQQNAATPRDTINSEMQTEAPPLSRCESRDADSCGRSAPLAGPDSGRGSSCTDASSPPRNRGSRPRAGTPPDHPGPDPTPTPTRPALSPVPNGGYVYQEEVRIECSGSPVGLKIVRSHETTAQSAPGAPSRGLVQCDIWSVSSAEEVIPLYRSSVHEGEVAGDQSCPGAVGAEEQCVPSYSDILLVGGQPTSHGEELPGLLGCDAPAGLLPSDAMGKVLTSGCGQGLPGEADVDHDHHDDNNEGRAAHSVKSVHFKILRLPFEMQYLEDLRKLEESVWSVESLMPYVPSAEWMVQHGFVEPEVVTEKTVVEVPMETSASQSEALPSLETSREVMVVQNKSQRESLSSLESLPPYLPSASWLADFGNVYYYSKLPLSVQEPLTIVGAPTNQLAAWKTPSKEQRGQRAMTAAAPHRQKEEKRRRARKNEVRGSLNRDGAPAPTDEARRNCGWCLSKRNVSASPDLAAVKRHRAAHPSTASGRLKAPTCSACELGPAKPAGKKRPGPGVASRRAEEEEMEDEAVENRAHPAVPKQQQQQQGSELGRAVDARKAAFSKRHSETCSLALCSKLREQNCSCEDPRRGPAREGQRRGLLADTTKEGNELAAPSIPAAEKWKIAEQRSLAQKSQTEKSWRATMAISDRESWENGARPRNANKPKKMSVQMEERQKFKMSNKAVTPRPQNADFGEPIEGYYNRSNWTKGTHRRDTRY